MTIKVSKRIKAICDFVPENSDIIDVGCDHAYISLYLTKHKKCTCVATDISSNAIERAKKNIGQLNIKTLVTDGLDGIKLDNQIVIIAGMGGDTIMRILNKDIKNDLIISSQSDIPKLRKYLYKKKYFLLNEKVIYEKNHYYVISYYRYGRGKKYYFISPYMTQNKDYMKYFYDKYKIKCKYSTGVKKIKYIILLLRIRKYL